MSGSDVPSHPNDESATGSLHLSIDLFDCVFASFMISSLIFITLGCLNRFKYNIYMLILRIRNFRVQSNPDASKNSRILIWNVAPKSSKFLGGVAISCFRFWR
jgi:hypothetical protein